MSSRARKQIKRRMEMIKQLPPRPQQPQVVISHQDTIERNCTCGEGLFRIAHRLRVFPAVSPKNPTGKDQLIKVEVYLREKCGEEFKL